MRQIEHYDVHEVIGEGHIGRVYRAVDRRNGQVVALKVLLDESPVDDARAYFENETAILPGLYHPHIPTCYDHSTGETAYLALEWIDGKDSETLLAELPEGTFLPPEQVAHWGVDICNALGYLHNHTPPIAFRDLKPSHIMVDREGSAWLVDFNLAKILPSEKILHDADLVGTEGYSAPEQYQGVVSPSVDMYALGATLHNLLTGIDPRHERLFTYAPPRSVNPHISKPLADVLMHALAYEPQDRFPSAKAMQTALLACL